MVPDTRRALLLALPLLLGMRDPFQPLPDRCQTAMLAQWRYQGFIDVNGHRRGVLRNAEGGWLRAAAGERLPPGWQVVSVTEQTLHITTAAGCEPAQWQWSRQGVKDEKVDNGSRAASQHAASMGKRSAAGDAGRR